MMIVTKLTIGLLCTTAMFTIAESLMKPELCNSNHCPPGLVDPVCGVFTKITYVNPCVAEASACPLKMGVLFTKGKCDHSDIKGCYGPCQRINKPVCGSDGKTYINQCNLKNAQCKDPNMMLMRIGRCQDTHVKECERPCPKVLRPICGSDGKTYNNDCLLRNAQCKDSNIRLMRRGRCGITHVKECDRPCPRHLMSVCGSNGKTYDNECFLRIAQCKDSNIKFVRRGRCGTVDEYDLGLVGTLPPRLIIEPVPDKMIRWSERCQKIYELLKETSKDILPSSYNNDEEYLMALVEKYVLALSENKPTPEYRLYNGLIQYCLPKNFKEHMLRSYMKS